MKIRMSVGSIVVCACALIAMSLPAVAAPVAQAVQAPNHRLSRVAAWPGSTSGNWSGYAGIASSGKLTFASATWKVPSVQAKNGYSSSWVGIDGANNSDLIQTGTEQDYVNGQFIYRAWWEILPAAETIIPSLTIHPGDTMSGSVKNSSGSKWVIALKDMTTGQSFSINKTYTGPGGSAEWIQEAPTGSSGVLPLAHYSLTKFSKLKIGFNFGAAANPHLQYPGMAIAMVKGSKIISIPSQPSAAGNAFNVAFGAKQPAAP